jgi:hypothetical protein
MDEFKSMIFNPLLWVMAVMLLIMSHYGPFALAGLP